MNVPRSIFLRFVPISENSCQADRGATHISHQGDANRGLFTFVERVIETDLVQELDLLRDYDKARIALRSIVDMPNRLIDLFIRICAQNKGVLSDAKRKKHFSMLTDDEVAQMQQAIKESHLVEQAARTNI